MALKCKHQRFEVKLWRTHSPISNWLTLIVCDEASNAQLWWLGYQGDLIVWKRRRNVLICARGIEGQSIGFWVQRSGLGYASQGRWSGLQGKQLVIMRILGKTEWTYWWSEDVRWIDKATSTVPFRPRRSSHSCHSFIFLEGFGRDLKWITGTLNLRLFIIRIYIGRRHHQRRW